MTTSDPKLQLVSEIDMWATMVIKEFETKVRMLKIHEENLFNSFKQHVYWHSSGELDKIEFIFNYYGRFVDMGVGRGVTLETRDAMAREGLTKRRPKRWFSSTFNRKVAQLGHIISERMAFSTKLIIVRGIVDKPNDA